MAQLCPNTPSTTGSQVPTGAPPPPPFLPHPTFSSRRLPWPLIQSSQLLPGPSAQPSSLPVHTNCASPSIKPFLPVMALNSPWGWCGCPFFADRETGAQRVEVMSVSGEMAAPFGESPYLLPSPGPPWHSDSRISVHLGGDRHGTHTWRAGCPFFG